MSNDNTRLSVPFTKSDKAQTTDAQIKSMQRLYKKRKPLTGLAIQLVRDMRGEPPAHIEPGQLYQLQGKKLHGVDSLALLVIPDLRAIVIDLSTGVMASVDKYGVRSTTLIGGRQ